MKKLILFLVLMVANYSVMLSIDQGFAEFVPVEWHEELIEIPQASFPNEVVIPDPTEEYIEYSAVPTESKNSQKNSQTYDTSNISFVETSDNNLTSSVLSESIESIMPRLPKTKASKTLGVPGASIWLGTEKFLIYVYRQQQLLRELEDLSNRNEE